MNDIKANETEAAELAAGLADEVSPEELSPEELDELHGAYLAAFGRDGVELPVLPPGPLTNAWVADSWSGQNRDAYRYATDLGRWLVFDGIRWSPTVTQPDGSVGDVLGEIGSSVIDYLGRAAEAQDERATAAARDKATAKGMMLPDDKLPKSCAGKWVTIQCMNTIRTRAAELQPFITHECMDRDPWTLTTPAGIVDLRSGVMRPATPLDLTMRCTVAAPERIATPLWTRFLAETFGGDPALLAYVQRAAGYWLTGDNSTRYFWILTGKGGNGKSVFLNTIAAAFGEYAKAAGADTFAVQFHKPHPEALASLAQARMIMVAEANDLQLNAGTVKAWSGGDPFRARFMAQDSWEFIPTGKLVFVANDPPTVKRVDDAWSDRVHVVPFDYRPAVKIEGLAKQIAAAELGGVLQWAVDGAAAYHRDGFLSCEAVRKASGVYLQKQDRFAEWLESSTAPDLGGKVKLSAIVDRYAATGGDALSRGALRKELEARGLKVAMASSRDGEQLHVFGIMLPYLPPT